MERKNHHPNVFLVFFFCSRLGAVATTYQNTTSTQSKVLPTVPTRNHGTTAPRSVVAVEEEGTGALRIFAEVKKKEKNRTKADVAPTTDPFSRRNPIASIVKLV